MKRKVYESICLVSTILALALGAANKIRLGAPPDAQPHLARVREAASHVTGDVPGMIVKQGHLPRQAFELLRPNVLESRAYTDLANSMTYSVLLVHCGDINDMGAHYPPACYPGSGFKVSLSRPMPLELGGRMLNGVEYELRPSRVDDREAICIWNCMFLPGGTSTYQPVDLRSYARVANLRYYGSGQLQVLVRASVSESDRLAVYRQALSIYEPVIAEMLSDPQTTAESTRR